MRRNNKVIDIEHHVPKKLNAYDASTGCTHTELPPEFINKPKNIILVVKSESIGTFDAFI